MVSAETGSMVTAREKPELVLVRQAVEEMRNDDGSLFITLRLEAPGMSPLTLPNKTESGTVAVTRSSLCVILCITPL